MSRDGREGNPGGPRLTLRLRADGRRRECGRAGQARVSRQARKMRPAVCCLADSQQICRKSIVEGGRLKFFLSFGRYAVVGKIGKPLEYIT